MPFDKKEGPFDSDSSPEEEEPKRYTNVFSHVSTFFGWLGELITEQARVEAKAEEIHPPLHVLHEITHRQQKTSEVIANARRICDNLDEIKLRLSSEFGPSSASFISKCIEPMIQHARQLIADLLEPSREESSLQNLLEQAIESVELYSQFSDESKLRKKIVQVAQDFIKQTIDKDLEVLANYKRQAIESANIPANFKEEKEFQLDGYLYPIVSELVGMSESRIETDDLHAFLIWKNNVDDRRNSLLELGLLTIDAMLGLQEQAVLVAYDDDDEGEIALEEPLSDLLRHNIEDSSLAMSYLSVLEERAGEFLERLAANDIKDPNIVDEMQQFLDYLKTDAERFAALSKHTKYVIDSFKALKERILEAEQLLNLKKSK